VLTALSFGLIAPASLAQAPSLVGETLESVQPLTFDSFTCNANGTTTVTFRAEGNAFGPYFGTFVETGTVTIGPQTNTTIDSRGVGVILDFQATFTITSLIPAGTVTGSKQLAPNAPTVSNLFSLGLCDPDGSSPPNTYLLASVVNPFVLYNAQINATTGSGSDSGTTNFQLQSVPAVFSPLTFQESFVPNEPTALPCEEDGNAQRRAAGKKKPHDDDDDDDDCQGEDED